MKERTKVFVDIIIFFGLIIALTFISKRFVFIIFLMVPLSMCFILWGKKRDNKTASMKKVNWTLIPGETYCFRGTEGKWWNWEFVKISHNPKMPFIAKYVDNTERNFNAVVRCGIVSPGSRDIPPSSEIMTADNYEILPISSKKSKEV